jgi:membrane protease YdiL (CAAX protease family)
MGTRVSSLTRRRIYVFFRSFVPFLAFIIVSGILQSYIPSIFSIKYVGGFMQPVLLTLLIFAARRILDKKSIGSLGLRRSRFLWTDIIWGFASIIVSLVLLLLMGWLLGWGSPQNAIQALRNATTDSRFGIYPSVLLGAFLTAWSEELLFRGYMFKNISWSTNVVKSALVTSVIFGFLHILSIPGWNFLTHLDILSITLYGFLGGILLVFAYIRTRNLWICIGLHTAWNSLTGPIIALGFSQERFPAFMVNIFNSPKDLMGVKDIFITGIAILVVYLITLPRNNHHLIRKALPT